MATVRGRPVDREAARERVRLPAFASQWSPFAWGAIAVTATFIAITCWWLAVDSTVPSADPASHLNEIVSVRELLAGLDPIGIVERFAYYPPTTYMPGVLGSLLAPGSVDVPILAGNLFYVPVLAAGCYFTGKVAYGPAVGLLAVVFVLGSPLLIEQFHVYMLDAPMAAWTAAAVALVLASDRFRDVRLAALAGLVAGLGVASKEQYPSFVWALVLVVLLRGGWRNWRGFGAFLLLAAAVGAPWYLIHLEDIDSILHAAEAEELTERSTPPLLSIPNLTWYFWALLNGVLFAPLFAFAAIGVGVAVVRIARSRSLGDYTPELLAGGIGSWLALSATPHHDMRYAMPVLVYLGVLGTAWIPRLRPRPRALATGTLGLAAVAATLGAAFGLGGVARIGNDEDPLLVRSGLPASDAITFHANRNFLVLGPQDDADVLDLFRAMREDGVRAVAWTWNESRLGDPRFDYQGVLLYARLTGLDPVGYPPGLFLIIDPQIVDLGPREAYVIRRARYSRTPPCIEIGDGTAVWIRLGNPRARGARNYCPFRDPPVYGP